MAKQNIFIGTRDGNKRIEAAIPKFQRELGMEKDQATAVAIRLESIGQLKKTIGPTVLLAALAKMKKEKQPQTPKQTQITKPIQGAVVRSAYDVRNKTRTNRLRERQRK